MRGPRDEWAHLISTLCFLMEAIEPRAGDPPVSGERCQRILQAREALQFFTDHVRESEECEIP